MPQPLGGHEEVTGFLSIVMSVQCYQSGLPYIIPKIALVKPPKNESAYSPDVLIVNQANLTNEPLWNQESTLIYGASIPLVVEVVSQCVARVPRVEATDVSAALARNERHP